MAHDVYNKAIIDIVSPYSLASQPYVLKDLHLKSTTPRNLDFSSPFTLTSTTPKRTTLEQKASKLCRDSRRTLISIVRLQLESH
jgi:hypothetical protein